MTDLIEELPKHDHWNRRLLHAIFACFGIPDQYLDVGCGTGAMVIAADKMGVTAVGLDIIPNDSDLVNLHDLRYPFNYGTTFDLVTCIEVMEHIPAEHEHVAIQSIAAHMREKSILVFTAAGPGQNGIDHVNTRLGSHWRTMFYDLGVSYREDYTFRLKNALFSVPSPGRDYLMGNVQVFDK